MPLLILFYSVSYQTPQAPLSLSFVQSSPSITINSEDITEDYLQLLVRQNRYAHSITVVLRSEWYPSLIANELRLLAHFFPYVHELNISETNIHVQDLYALAYFKNLNKLDISGNNLDTQALEIIVELFNNTVHLKL